MLKKIGIAVLILVVAFIALMIFAPEASTPTNSTPSSEDFITFEDDTSGLSFSHPSTWQHSTTASDYVAVFLLPYDADNAVFQPNIRVYTQPLATPSTSLEAYNEASKATFVGTDGAVTVIENTKTTFAGQPAYRLVSELTDTTSGMVYRSLAVYTIIDEQEYLVTFSAPNDLFVANLDAVEAMLDTVQLSQ